MNQREDPQGIAVARGQPENGRAYNRIKVPSLSTTVVLILAATLAGCDGHSDDAGRGAAVAERRADGSDHRPHVRQRLRAARSRDRQLVVRGTLAEQLDEVMRSATKWGVAAALAAAAGGPAREMLSNLEAVVDHCRAVGFGVDAPVATFTVRPSRGTCAERVAIGPWYGRSSGCVRWQTTDAGLSRDDAALLGYLNEVVSKNDSVRALGGHRFDHPASVCGAIATDSYPDPETWINSETVGRLLRASASGTTFIHGLVFDLEHSESLSKENRELYLRVVYGANLHSLTTSTRGPAGRTRLHPQSGVVNRAIEFAVCRTWKPAHACGGVRGRLKAIRDGRAALEETIRLPGPLAHRT